ncbi:MAG: hypothetical protein P8182_02295 [Deltaproteobacteria bacterium]
MDPLGLVVVEDQIFLSRVVNSGMEQGIFTRDRADEIIRISVAMANKYVLRKEVDFRSTYELAKVQETIMKLVGVGLEIKSKGVVEEGVRLLMEDSPVDLFRLADTRISKLRQAWKYLLQDHRVEILVSSQEYQCLDDLACQRLSEMSIFSDPELEAISSTKLEDSLFSTLAVVEYYESELERHKFIVSLKDLLPFDLLNRSPSVRAGNLAETDSIREALVNTLIISGYMDSKDPVAVTMDDVRGFLEALDLTDAQSELFPEEIEEVLLDLVQELGEGLAESEAALLAKEIIRIGQHLIETILSASQPEEAAPEIAADLPWNRLMPDQVIRLFQEFPHRQSAFAMNATLKDFDAAEIVDLLEATSAEAVKHLMPSLETAMGNARFTLEDLELIASLPHKEIPWLLRMANPPADYSPSELRGEFREAPASIRRIILYAAWGTDWFPEFLEEAWSLSPDFVKRFVRGLSPAEIGPFLDAASGDQPPHIVKLESEEPRLQFASEELNTLFESLPSTKRKTAVRYFQRGS